MGAQTGLAVVTGAAGGLGGACARRLARAGYDLLLTDIGPGPLEAAAAALRAGGAKVETLVGDVADPAFPSEVVGALGARPLGALVHAAGLSPTMGEPERIIEVNLFASARLLDGLLPTAQAGTAVVVIASMAGHMPISPEADAAFNARLAPDSLKALAAFAPTPSAAYTLSKRGVLRLVERGAAAWGAKGARITSISPGTMDTGMGRAEFATQPAMAVMIERSPINRWGTPDEIGAVAAFLCSADASFMTGCDLRVDGGTLAMLSG
jgi:NAD(P)-dependent dehydrogenase (short-subunit alcohol dehydrogenase family)